MKAKALPNNLIFSKKQPPPPVPQKQETLVGVFRKTAPVIVKKLRTCLLWLRMLVTLARGP